MRIGLFSEVYPPYISGVATSVKMLKKELEKKGHTVYVVTVNLDGLKLKYDDSERVLKVPSIPTKIYEDIRLSSVYPMNAVKKVKKWNLDVIHLHTELGIGNFAKLFGKRYNIPLVYTFHTIYEDAVSYVTKGVFDEFGKKAIKHLAQGFCKDITEVIVPGEKAYKILKDKYELKNSVQVVPNGIETERFYKETFSYNVVDAYRKDAGLKKDDFVLAYIGRVAPEKSINVLINGMKDIVKNNEKIKLLIVGDGPEKVKLEKLTKKHKLEDNVIFTGKVPWDKVPNYYQLGTVFVTASTFENHSMTVIEAMSASLPVVCINDSSYKSMVIEKTTGRIFKNKKEFVNIIKEVSKDNKAIEKMSIEARLMAEKYSAREYARKVLKVYNKAIEGYEDTRLGWISKLANAIKKKKGE